MPPPERRRPEAAPAAAFVVSILGAVGVSVVYWLGGQTQWEGALLAVALGGLGVGLALWAQRFLPQGPVVEERGRLASTEEEIQAFVHDFDADADGVARRRLLVRLLVGAGAALGIAALFPIRSLGPRPGQGLFETPYAGGGKRLVTVDGEKVRSRDVGQDGVLTVFPEGHTDAADAPTLLIRLRPGVNQPQPGREGYTVGDLVAYSKLCTHLGCPVGLYQAQSGLLLCPCHQSTFDVADGCNPIFGPATRRLPQLPIAEDPQGYLVATADFSSPVGPGFWDRGRGD